MILGLDISTTLVGIAILDDNGKLIKTDGLDISKISNTFERLETVGAELYTIRSEYDIKDVFIETALKKFLPGKSRADTIIKLAKFNGVVSWICFECFEQAPTYINVNTSRT